MNKRGQVIFYTLMLGVLILILVLSLAPTVKYFTDGARNSTFENQAGLDCQNESISEYQKGQCYVTDLTLPYWTYAMFGIVAAILVARLIIGGPQ